MANPQIEEGYTPIANEIIEALMRVNLSAYESRVLWFLFRKTYGWDKKTDWITLSQFSKCIGLDRRLIHRAIKELSSKKMIVIERDDGLRLRYGFQKNYEKWVLSSKKMTVIDSDDGLSSKEMIGLSSIQIHTKDTSTKETITKKRIKPPSKSGAAYSEEFLTFWNAYPKRSGSKKAAFDIWRKLNGERPDIETILHAITIQTEWRARASPGEFRPEWKDPERWIKNRMWEADVTIPGEQEDSIAQWLKQSSPTQ